MKADDRRVEFRNRRNAIANAVRTRTGDTLAEIGKEFGITRERVRQIAKSLGVERRKKPE